MRERRMCKFVHALAPKIARRIRIVAVGALR